MTRAQSTALQYPCRLAIETANPRFGSLVNGGLCTLVLTVNSGYE